MTPERLRWIARADRVAARHAREILDLADDLEARDNADAETQLDRERLLEHARRVRRRRDVHSVYEVLDWQAKRIAELEAALNRLLGFVERSHVAFSDNLLKAEAMGECAAAAEVYHKGHQCA